MSISKVSFTNLPQLLPANPWLRSLVINLIVWGGILTFGAWGSYLDNIKAERGLHFSRVWMHWIANDFLLFLLSCVLYPLLGKYPSLVANAKSIRRLFLCLSLLFYPFHAIFQLFVSWKTFDLHLRHNSFIDYVFSVRNSGWFFCFAYFAAIVTAIIFVRTWHENRERQASINKIQTDNLALNLALEQQKLQSLRQQLEPHFIFNALNAISALVRTNEKSVALTGIHRLSDLLRYALTASNKDWVTFKDELDFIRDYLALQQLRYGERLTLKIEGDTPAILHGDCLPLLLQPLIENALRHDLDCHEEASTILLKFRLHRDQVHIEIHNRLQSNAAKNPGLGLGLSQTHLRLQMMYRGSAEMNISQTDEEFRLLIMVPLHHPEARS